MILAQVSGLSAEAYFSLTSNYRIVQYETKSYFEIIDCIYNSFNIFFLWCYHLSINRFSGPT